MNPKLEALLGAGWRQTDRLLILSTPLGDEALLAESARIDEALGPVAEHAGFRIELTALSADAGLSLDQMLGQPVRLDLQTAASRNVRRPFHGHITYAEREGADGGFARYRLIVEPWIAFLGHNRDSYFFQDKTVVDIVDEILGDWQGQGKLVPAWEWRLADASLYPKRGMTAQYRESDLAFIKRLLAEEGLFCWFEHAVEDGETLGRHTLVIADHNGAFPDNAQATVRFTQAGATLSEDSVDRWVGLRRLDTMETHATSWDYRSLSVRGQSSVSGVANGDGNRTAAWLDPGQYAWQSSAHGERMIGNQRQAIDGRLKQFEGAGTVRSAAPGTHFSLAEHPEHERDEAEQRRFLTVRVRHRARNNLNATIPRTGDDPAVDPQNSRKTAVDRKTGEKTDPEAVFYRNELTAIRAGIAWRPLMADGHGRRIHPRPTVAGKLTAVVVGDGGPTHTDRDGRVRVQFPWQRGAAAGSRHDHPSGTDNAPANASLGIWLRVMSPVAGSNWGGHLIPRPGQEVLVAFLNGNIDRPVVIGAVYNGRGQDDAPGNRIAGGTMQATANAPAFFAGKTDPQHAHGAALSGIKTQQLSSSRSGNGGYNQLVFDDTPGEGRIELGTTEYASALRLGHLKQQTDNARQADRGHGAELSTQASLAVRAGNGLLLSADARPNACSSHLDSREAIARTQAAGALTHGLAELARKQNAGLPGESDTLPTTEGWRHAGEVLSATVTQGGAAAAGGGDIKATQGGLGTVPGWSEPRLQVSAPAGIVQVTPENHVLTAGTNFGIAAQDVNLVAQGHWAAAIRNGLALFTAGQAGDGEKPNQETGIHLHAASGSVSLQSQSGKTTAAADQRVTIASTQANLKASGKEKLLATAQGAYLKLEGGNIELHAPGPVKFKASMKKLTGPKSASATAVDLPKASEIKGCAQQGAKGLDALSEF
ncbi:MAG: type VI secretion system tip protein VgrG [Azonexaceae bacterium]|nr:type VI secretion system tip protein VgrG [Azonexaceae bacterium]